MPGLSAAGGWQGDRTMVKLKRKRAPMRLAALGALVVLVPSCAVSGPEPSVDPVDARRDLAVRAGEETAEGNDSRGRRPKDPPSDGSNGSNDPAASGNDPSASTPEDDGAPAFRTAGSIEDAIEDAGPHAPGYGDAIAVRIEDDGTRARIAVRMVAPVPARTAEDEVIGIGVDLTRGEDEYQVFGSGEPDGWFAYLYEPGGLTRYRGSFEVIDRQLVFTVPWTALGGRAGGTFSAFVDWTGPGAVGSDAASQDLVPDRGTAHFEPSR